MKKILFNLFIILFAGTTVFGQLTQGLKYQAVVRDASGTIIQNQTVGLQISILQGSETGISVYTETWNIQTNDFGLVNLQIGVGEGNSSDDFTAIPWGTDDYWVKIELDETGGTDYTEMGTSQLLSVPYSLYSQAPWSPSGENIYYNAGNVGIGTSDPQAKFEIQSTDILNDTLFCVKDSKGRPVFIVYPDGVQVIVDTTSTKSGASGRFLVSGRGLNKNDKGTELNFMDLTNKNYLIGHNVAPNLVPGVSDGIKNSILGYEAGYFLETGYEHTLIGYKAGYSSVGGNSNVFIGNNAGFSSETGIGNVNIGFSAGYSNNHNPGSNVFIGQASGYGNTSGNENVYIGYQVGALGSGGDRNVYLGPYTGEINTGSGNVFIGADVGSTVITSNMLYIDNSETVTPLIWGDFESNILKIYGSLNVNDVYTFPVTDGTDGQVLKTDGNGILTWSNVTKSFEKSEVINQMKVTIEEQQSQIEQLINENDKIKNKNKVFEERLKALEKRMNEK